MKIRRPPFFPSWILERILDENVRYSAMGDFEERFEELAGRRGKLAAGLFYRIQVLLLLLSYFKAHIFWSLEMFKNYLKVTLRIFKRQKGYSFINIFGLAVGMACCLMIMLWVNDELSFDRYHEHADNIYRLSYAELIGGASDHYAMSPFPAAPVFKAEIPEFKTFTRMLTTSALLKYDGKNFEIDKVIYAEKD
ncbi:ABC transporter permease, partial [Acidobacteriota bacterium]